MSEKREIVIDGIKYVSEQKNAGEKLRIVIVDNRELTFVGYVNINQSLETIATIRQARCVIRWGTTKHLAELVDGPLPNTILGACEDVDFPLRNLVVSYLCNENKEAWYK